MKEQNCLEDHGVGWKTIVTWLLKKQDVRVWSGFNWLR